MIVRRLLGAALSAVLLSAAPASADASPRCHGAAARDPEQPCSNPAQRLRVTPRPDAALLIGDSPCEPVGESTELCTFGELPERATGTVALLGDSHARHYRATVAVLARAKGWHAYSLTRPKCPFTLAVPDITEPHRTQCPAFNRDVLEFVADHPEISTVFVSQNRLRIVPQGGGDPREELVQGYVDAWDALPSTVTRVVVMRDPFYDRPSTPDCVRRALRQRRSPGVACALRRATALKPDPAMTAAARPHRAGLQVDAVDFTPFFCGARRCFPVVGGVLVHRDIGHLTQAFATTLGPYLLRAFERATAA